MSRDFQLRSYEFRRERASSWRELESLVSRCEKSGPRSLSARELARLPMLYRAALSSLSVARGISLDRALQSYLESLTARAYFVVYRPKERAMKAFVEFFWYTFPQAVRHYKRPLQLAMAIFVAGALTGYLMTLHDDANFYTFVNARLAGDRGPSSSVESLKETLYSEESRDGNLATFAAYLFNNNATIGLLAFALGGLAGIPVFLLLFNNGLMLGAFAAIHAEKGLSVDLWGWLLPHGVTEILAIVLCGAGGLGIARGILFPKDLGRVDALKVEGRSAGAIALGSIALFVLAGLLEGFFRQMVQDIYVRYAVAMATAFLWAWYFGRCGKGRVA